MHTGFTSQHPTIHLGSMFREGGAAGQGSTGSWTLRKKSVKTENYHF